MNHKPNPDRSFLNFMLRAQQLARQDARSDKGYVMMMTSLISISLFSLLAAYFTLTNLSKSSTDAYIDGTSTFYAAESGLNRRADQLRQKFIGYATPTGTVTYTAASLLSTCLSVPVGAAISSTNDFECRNYSFAYNNNIAQATSGGNTVISEQDGGRNRINYTAYTFVRPALDYSTTPPDSSVIPSGEIFAGLNALEYRYTVYATAAKPDPNSATSAVQQTGGQTVLQMDFRSRLIPLFQFAAFYGGDLEILPGQAMTLSGPVHSNGSLYLGSNNLTIAGNVTSVGSIFSKRKNNDATSGGSAQITTSGAGVTPIVNTSLLAANGGASTTYALSPANLTATFGTQVKSGIGTLTVPSPGFIGKVDAGQPDGIGAYYGKADLRIQYQPSNAAVPLTVTAIKTGVAGADSTTCAASLNISANRNERNQLVCSTLTNDQLRSLRQPVLVRAVNANERLLAPTGQTFNPTPTPADIANAIALQRLIVKSGVPLNFNQITTVLTALPGVTAAELAPFTTSPRQIANQAGYFYLPPPIQVVPTGFINNRERVAGVRTTIQMVQTNIRSLAFWNRDNVVVDAANTDTSQDEVLFRRLQNPLATGSKYATVCNGLVADPRNRSLQCLGLAASDTSEGGLVLHATLDTAQAPVYAAGQSPYGFAFVGGSNLPGALTIASDQAVYLQGDYNYFDRTNTPNTNSTVVTNLFKISNDVPTSSGLKEPASILADSLNILSNQCNLPTSTTDRLTCGINTDAAVAATTTSMNVAFLAGTDVTIAPSTSGGVTTPGVYNGGLENYPRFHENWGGQTLNYRGSFISLGTPLNVSGTWANQVYGVPNRNWNYDVAFNSASNLPPLTPRLISLRQDVFRRMY